MQLEEASLDWSLTHIERFGDTNIFPIPFEYSAIRQEWDSVVRPFLASQNMLEWVTQPYRRCLTSKHRYGYRMATQLDPLDCIVFNSLIYELGHEIEAARLPKTQNIAISWRFFPGPKGQLYDTEFGYQRFQEVSRQLADDPKITHVIVADIADFFPRLYAHPLENALESCTSRPEHVKVLMRMLSQWNYSISYGIPIGPRASFILAELVLDDVDRGLLSEGTVHCRWVDDYRIFCTSERDAYSRLILLANILFESQGLTLQPIKTTIMSRAQFEERLEPKWMIELRNLSRNFDSLLKEMGIDNRYQEVEIDQLSDDAREKLENLNLVEILRSQITRPEPLDESLTRFVLMRLAQIDKTVDFQLLIKNSDRLYSVFVDVIRYIRRLRSLDSASKAQVGRGLLGLLEASAVGDFTHYRQWILSLFASDTTWDNDGQLTGLYNRLTDPFSQRKLILAMGRAHHHNWFKTRKRDISGYAPWSKRAFLAAASCLPGDEAKHWYRSIDSSLNTLEKAVVAWAKQNRF